MRQRIDLKYIKENKLIIFDAISGSQAYGTATPQSDTDIRGVFVIPQEFLLPKETTKGWIAENYVDQVSDEKNDTVYYELRKFVHLVAGNNPNMLELLNVPEDCIVYKHPVMDILLSERDRFLTKICKYTFAGYVHEQLRKASGLNKKQKWDKERITRKTPMDFCYALIGEQSIPLEKYLEENALDKKFCGLTKVPHAKDVYALFYDEGAADCFSEMFELESREYSKSLRIKNGLSLGLGYKGVAMDDSNKIRLSEIPKGENPILNIFYNEDGYSMHCREYKEYQEWLEKRNTARYTDFESHGQGLDGKNMLHCRRLLEMAEEIATGKGINVRRPNAEYLLKIRRGEVPLQELVEYAQEKVKDIDVMFENSDLPKSIDEDFVNEILKKMRREFYNTIEYKQFSNPNSSILYGK